MTAASTKTVTNESSSHHNLKPTQQNHDPALDTDVERKQITVSKKISMKMRDFKIVRRLSNWAIVRASRDRVGDLRQP